MKFILITYMAVYALALGGMLLVYIFAVPLDEKKGDRWWTTPLDTLLVGLAFTGMFLLASGNDSAFIKTTWKFLAPAMVAIQLYLNVRARAEHMSVTGDTSDLQSKAGDFAILIFVAPALALNLAYAFAR